MDGSVRQVAPGTFVETETWHTTCRARTRSAARPDVAFEVLDAGDTPQGYGEAHEYSPGCWTLRVACACACDFEKQHNLLEAITEAVRERGGSSIETTIGYASSVMLELFRASGLRIASLISYGGEAALLLQIDSERAVQPVGGAVPSASIRPEKSTIIGR